MVTAKKVKKILLAQRKRNRERQKEHMEKMRAQGYRRIAVLVSGEAHKALEQAVKDQDKTKSELVTEALVTVYGNLNNKVSTNINVLCGTTQKTDIDKLIIQYKDEGMSYQQIADKLNAEGVPTASEKGIWHKGTISHIMKRLRKGGQ